MNNPTGFKGEQNVDKSWGSHPEMDVGAICRELFEETTHFFVAAPHDHTATFTSYTRA